MKDSRQKLFQEEISRCRRFYQGVEEVEPFLREVFEEIFSFLSDNNEREGMLEKVSFDKNKARLRLKKGESMGVNPSFQADDFVNLLQRLGKVVVKNNPELKTSLYNFQTCLEQFQNEFEGRITREDVWEFKDLLLNEGILARDMATFLFSLGLSTFFRFDLEKVAESLRTDLWEGGNCALCGEKPHFGMLRSEDGAKVLECWLCGTQWVHTRIKCPFCSNTAQEEMGYFTVEENEVCRVQFCRRCGSYYKVFDTRKIAEEDIILLVHNLATLSHDLLAREEGFKPGSGLEWAEESETTELND